MVQELTGTDLERGVREKLIPINEYLLTDQNNDRSIGIHTGLSGECLMTCLNYLAFESPEYETRIYEILDLLNKKIETGKNLGWSFSTGLPGWGWLISFMVDKKLLDPDIEDELTDIDAALKQQMIYLLNAGDIDQLHGALGIARYFLRRGKYAEVNTVVNYLFDSRVDVNDEIKWRKEHLVKKGTFHYDLGLAHGITGIIYFLMKCYRNGIETEKAKLLIDGSIRFLLNNRQEFKTIGADFASSFFCDEYDTSVVTPVKSRLAWCYGDLTIWYTLLNAAILFENEDLKSTAIDGLLRSGTRTSLTDSLIVDANFCHGSAGVSYIFQKAYLITGVIDFEKISLYWLKKTMDFDSGTDNLPRYKFLIGNWEGRKFNECPDLLEGMAGVGITYLLRLFPHLNDWDECMMLS